MRPVVLLAASCALAACANTYHPEYHPVTVQQYSQNLQYPVTVHNGGSPAERSPVVIAPMPAPTVIAPPPLAAVPPVTAPPPGWPMGD